MGISYVAAIAEDDAAALVAEREAGGPFRDVSGLARRARLSRDGLEALVKSGACDGFGRPREACSGSSTSLFAHRRFPGPPARAKQLPLALEPTTETPRLRDLTRWERMLADYRHTGMSVGTHPSRSSARTCLRGRFRVRSSTTAHGRQVAFAGMTVARQSPPPRTGSSSCFSRTSTARVTSPMPQVYDRHRATVRAPSRSSLPGAATSGVGENHNVLVSSPSRSAPLARRAAESDSV